MNLFHWDTAQTLAVLSGLIIPGVSALLAKGKIPANVAGFLTLVLAAVSGFVAEWATSSNATQYDWKTAAGVSLFSLLVAIGAHYGFWKGTEVQAHLLAIGNGPAVNHEPAA